MSKYVWLGLILFVVGLIGVVITRRNVIICLMCIELMLLGTVLIFIVFGLFLEDLQGSIFVLFILTVAAAETAIGLALLVNYYRNNKMISMKSISYLKG